MKGAVRVWVGLVKAVAALCEPEPHERIPDLEHVVAPVLHGHWRVPGLDDVVRERIRGPFGDLVAQAADVLLGPRLGRAECTCLYPGSPDEGLEALPALAAFAFGGRGRASGRVVAFLKEG